MKNKNYDEYFEKKKIIDKKVNESHFSWMNPLDEPYFSTRFLKKKKSKLSLSLGLPGFFNGNIEDSNLFLCLNNPSEPDKVANAEDIAVFLDEDKESEDTPSNLLKQVTDITFDSYKNKKFENDGNPGTYSKQAFLNEYNYWKYFSHMKVDKFIERHYVKSSIGQFEPFPYRSRNVTDLGLDSKEPYSIECASTKFIIACIFRKIIRFECEDRGDQKLRFIFRSFPKWQKALMDFSEQFLGSQIRYDEVVKYFWCFPAQNGSVTYNNVVNVEAAINSVKSRTLSSEDIKEYKANNIDENIKLMKYAFAGEIEEKPQIKLNQGKTTRSNGTYKNGKRKIDKRFYDSIN